MKKALMIVVALVALAFAYAIVDSLDKPGATRALLAPQAPGAWVLSVALIAAGFKANLFRFLWDTSGLDMVDELGFGAAEFSLANPTPQRLNYVVSGLMQITVLHALLWYGFGGWIALIPVVFFLSKWLILGGTVAKGNRKAARIRAEGYGALVPPKGSGRRLGNPRPVAISTPAPTPATGIAGDLGEPESPSTGIAGELTADESAAWNNLVARLNQEN